MQLNVCTAETAAWRGEPLRAESAGARKNQILLSGPVASPYIQLFMLPEAFLPSLATGPLAVGTVLAHNGNPVLAVVSRHYLPLDGETHSVPCLRLRALEDLPEGSLKLVPQRSGPALAWVTVSDKGTVGLRKDESGPEIARIMSEAMPLRCHNGYIVPDDIYRMRSLVADLAMTQGYDFIITSGGTGLTTRDITPEALAPLVEKRLSGLEQAMLQCSLAVTPRGALSRPLCGSIGKSLLVTLPGSSKAVRENLGAILGALGHGLEKLQDSPVDCGSF